MLLFLSRAGRGDGERFRPNARFFEEIARSSLARASRRRSRPDPARSHVTFYASYWRSVRPRALNGLPYTLRCLMVTHLLIFCASRNFSPRPSLDEVLKHRNATDEVPNLPLEDSLLNFVVPFALFILGSFLLELSLLSFPFFRLGLSHESPEARAHEYIDQLAQRRVASTSTDDANYPHAIPPSENRSR
jgi:hypothetical protein